MYQLPYTKKEEEEERRRKKKKQTCCNKYCKFERKKKKKYGSRRTKSIARVHNKKGRGKKIKSNSADCFFIWKICGEFII